MVFDEKQIYLNCFSLSADIDCDKLFLGFNSDYASTLNYLIQNNLGIFNEKYFNEKNTLSLEKFETYTDNGKIFEDGKLTEGEDKNGKKDGTWTSWWDYDKTRKEMQGTYKSGKMVDKWYFYNNKGNLKEIRYFSPVF